MKIKKSKVQNYRYIALVSVILFFCFIPLSNWYANFKIGYNNARLVGLSDGPLASYVYAILDNFFMLFDDPVRAASSNNGSLWAFTIMGLPLSDPLGIISELINSVRFPIKYLLGSIIPILIAFVFGRFFCSWLCPMTVFFSLTKKIKDIMKKYNLPILELKIPSETRAFVFFIGMITSYFMGAWVWHFILPYITFSHEIFSYVLFGSFTVGIYFFVSILVLDIGLISGQFCNSICPTGWLLAQIGRFSIFKLKADAKNCPKGCIKCQKVCPIDLFPKEGNLYSCHLCYICVDNCPKKHIELKLNKFLHPKEKENL